MGELAWHFAKHQPQQIALCGCDRPVLLLDEAQCRQQALKTAGKGHRAQYGVGGRRRPWVTAESACSGWRAVHSAMAVSVAEAQSPGWDSSVGPSLAVSRSM